MKPHADIITWKETYNYFVTKNVFPGFFSLGRGQVAADNLLHIGNFAL